MRDRDGGRFRQLERFTPAPQKNPDFPTCSIHFMIQRCSLSYIPRHTYKDSALMRIVYDESDPKTIGQWKGRRRCSFTRRVERQPKSSTEHRIVTQSRVAPPGVRNRRRQTLRIYSTAQYYMQPLLTPFCRWTLVLGNKHHFWSWKISSGGESLVRANALFTRRVENTQPLILENRRRPSRNRAQES